MSNSENSNYCARCGVGKMVEAQMPFVGMLEGYVLSVPDMTFYTCDICGYREFDPETLGPALELLMDSSEAEDTNVAYPKSVSDEDLGHHKPPKP